jgi:hypothetical protein
MSRFDGGGQRSYASAARLLGWRRRIASTGSSRRAAAGTMRLAEAPLLDASGRGLARPAGPSAPQLTSGRGRKSLLEYRRGATSSARRSSLLYSGRRTRDRSLPWRGTPNTVTATRRTASAKASTAPPDEQFSGSQRAVERRVRQHRRRSVRCRFELCAGHINEWHHTSYSVHDPYDEVLLEHGIVPSVSAVVQGTLGRTR